MRVVGLRELKNRLSEYIRQVRAGEEVLVTDRGEVIAEISSPRKRMEDPDLPPGLLDLVKRGAVRLGGRNDSSLYPEMPKHTQDGTAERLLEEERGER